MRRSEATNGDIERISKPPSSGIRLNETRIRLSEATMPGDARTTTACVAATPLAVGQVQELISQLPDLPPIGTCLEPPPDQPDMPPALDGVVQQAVFPPRHGEATTHPSAGPSGPLRVLSCSPEGEADATSQIVVHFSHSMISLCAADQIPSDLPVRLTPQTQGHWQWLDPQTLCFVPDAALSMATEFCVEVAEGVQAVDGSVLHEAHAWSFRTAPPRMLLRYPEEQLQDTLPILFLGFDQRVDPAEMLAYIELTAEDNALDRRPLRLATQQELSAHEAIQACISQAASGTWLAVRPVEPLPHACRFQLRLRSGAPSQEGPLRTPVDHVFDFLMCGPLAVVEHRVGWDEQVGPEADWQIRFSNLLDPRSVDRNDIHVEPEMPELDVALWDQTLVVHGWRQANTSYRLTLPAGLRDVFGQKLSTPTTLNFQVGRAEARVFVKGRFSASWDTVFLQPEHGTNLPIFSVNQRALLIRIHAVNIEDWPTYSDPELRRAYSRYFGYGEDRKGVLEIMDWLATHLPGPCVEKRLIEITGHENDLVETLVDLQSAIQGVFGHAVVVIQGLDRLDHDPLVIWCQVTRIGLHAFADQDGVMVWTTDLQTGEPLEDVTLRLEGLQIESRSGPDGRAWLPRSEQIPQVLVARRGDDVAILPENYRDWPNRERRQKIVWCAMDGRGIYRPGEEIRLKAWPRLRVRGRHGTVHLLDRPYQALCQLFSRQGSLIEQRVDVDPQTGLDVRFALPKDMPTGKAAIRIVIPEFDDSCHHHYVRVEEYREPEFEVVLSADSGQHITGSRMNITAQASYYSGGPLPYAQIAWNLQSSRTTFRPPGFDRFSFGQWLPWWVYRPRGDDRQQDEFPPESLRAETDHRGQHTLCVDFSRLQPSYPVRLTIRAAVTDVNRQCWGAQHSVVIHPAEIYVGLSVSRVVFQTESPIPFDVVVVDPQGAIVDGQIVELELHRVRPVLGGMGEEPVLELMEVISIQSEDRPQTIVLSPQHGGNYRLVASVRDSNGRRTAVTNQDVWVVGGIVSATDKEFIHLIPDKEHYEPGEIAEILVQASFSPAEALLTIRRDGVLHSETLKLSDRNQIIRLPITDEHYPEIHLSLDAVGLKFRSGQTLRGHTQLEGQPVFATGWVTLKVPPRARELSVAVRVREPELRPGDGTEIEVSVHRADGGAAGLSEVVIMVVDEAVLALGGYEAPDPLAEMYQAVDWYSHSARSRTSLLPRTIAWHPVGQFREPPGAGYVGGFSRGLLDQPIAATTGGSAEGAPAAAIRVRDTFRAVALFVPSAVTDAQGRVAVPIQLPDNVTRYRVMVMAAWGADHFGRGKAAITTKLPLTIRPATPRFAYAGDRFELAAIVQNNTESTQEVAVAAKAQNMNLEQPHGWWLELPSQQRAEVRFAALVLK